MEKIAFVLVFLMIALAASAQDPITWSEPIDLADSSFGNEYPRVVAGNQQEVYVTWGGGQQIYFAKIDEQGASDPILLNTDETVAYVGSWTGADIAASGDTIYVTFMHATWGREAFLVRSFDGGDSFSEPIALESYADSTSRFPSVAIMPDGNPIVAFMKMTSNEGHPEYVVRRSNDFGASYLLEQPVGSYSGEESEACDCCPGGLVAKGSDVAVLYRDNLNNVRDIWATTSQDGGEAFSYGFDVDNAGWVINGCPSTGPDGIIVGNRLFTVYHSDGACYISKSGLEGGIFSRDLLGEESTEEKNQNFPRICEDGGQGAAMVWRDNTDGQKLFLSYTPQINTANPEYEHHLLHEGNFSSADVTIVDDKVYVLMQDASGAVKYIVGQMATATDLETSTRDTGISLYPNPAESVLHLELPQNCNYYTITDINGALNASGQPGTEIDISQLKAGSYIIQLYAEKDLLGSRQFNKL